MLKYTDQIFILKNYKKKKYSVNDYQAFDDKCVSVREYLDLVGKIDKNKKDDQDIMKEYIRHKVGDFEYELMMDLGWDTAEVQEQVKKYIYEPSFNDIFADTYADNHDYHDYQEEEILRVMI